MVEGSGGQKEGSRGEVERRRWMEENKCEMEEGVKEKHVVQASPVSTVFSSKWCFLKIVPEGASCLML